MSNQSTILACTDGSRYATSVYDHAAWAASQMDASVHVLHVVDNRSEAVPHVDLSGHIGLNARIALREELVALDEARGRAAQAKANIILNEAKAHFAQKNLTSVKFEAKHGYLVDTIEAMESKAELVIVGKRGEKADLTKLHLGGNLERVIRNCHHPVLVASRAFKPIESMLIAFDGGNSARKAVEYVAKRPLLKGVECLLIAVGKPSPTIENDLQAAHDTLRLAGVKVEARHEKGEPEDVFAKEVERSKIDLLVMGAYGHSRIRQFVLGSTTETMVRTCLVPVLMFR